MTLVITPQTKLGELLDAYPVVEDSLMEWVPAFEKLKNPILRRTVAKVATLEQAARMGGVAVRDLVLRLREQVGQSEALPLDVPQHSACGHAHPTSPLLQKSGTAEPAPAWIESSALYQAIDADAMLALGEHPLGTVHAAIAAMPSGSMLRIDSSFRPAPLIDMLIGMGMKVYGRALAADRHQTWIAKNPSL
jgi:hypothetical protein